MWNANSFRFRKESLRALPPTEEAAGQPSEVRSAGAEFASTSAAPPSSPPPTPSDNPALAGLRLLAESCPEIVLILELSSGRILEANPAAETAYGQPRAELVSRRYADLLFEPGEAGPDTLPEERPDAHSALHRRTDGRPFAVEIRTAEASLGEMSALVCTLKDLEQAASAAAASRGGLVENEERLRLAYQVAGLGTWDWQPDWDYSIHTNIFFEIHGLTVPADHHVNLDEYMERVHPDDRLTLMNAIQNAATSGLDAASDQPQGGAVIDPPFRFTGEDGRERWIQCYRRNFYENGSLVRQIGTAQDVTRQVQYERELRRANQALSESEQRFRHLVDSIDDFIFTLDREQRHTGIYSRSLERFGISADQLLGRTPVEALGEEAGAIHADANQRALAGEVLTYEWSVLRGPAVFHFQTRLSPLRSESGEISGVVGLGRDITSIKETELRLAEYARQLERSNRELEDFAFVASHDLQEPLRKIRAFSASLMRLPANRLDEDTQDSLKRMNRAAERMQQMVTSLLELSRVNTRGQPFQRVELGPVLHEVLSDLELQLHASRGQVTIQALPAVQGDPLQLRRLFSNLISNALKFCQEGQLPEINIQGEVLRQPGQPPQVRVSVQDNGIGFSMDNLERIFQPFQRLHGRNKYEGTGMGLAICRRIVERHGGSITAHSQVNQGTRFVIDLPAAPDVVE
jgi:PAS domain S-box-containing protein